jgi:Methyl-accepting chemotaxis protein (MCP) signalling domain
MQLKSACASVGLRFGGLIALLARFVGDVVAEPLEHLIPVGGDLRGRGDMELGLRRRPPDDDHAMHAHRQVRQAMILVCPFLREDARPLLARMLEQRALERAGAFRIAQRSASAAAGIKTLIQDSNRQVQDGVRLVSETGESLTEIVGSVVRVSEIVSAISGASKEQATDVDDISAAVAEMDRMTQKNAAMVEETTAALKMLSDEAAHLAKLLTFFSLEQDEQLAEQAAA